MQTLNRTNESALLDSIIKSAAEFGSMKDAEDLMSFAKNLAKKLDKSKLNINRQDKKGDDTLELNIDQWWDGKGPQPDWYKIILTVEPRPGKLKIWLSSKLSHLDRVVSSMTEAKKMIEERLRKIMV